MVDFDMEVPIKEEERAHNVIVMAWQHNFI